MASSEDDPRSDPFRYRRSVAALAVISGYAVAAAGVIWGVQGLPTLVRIPLVLPVLLFVPGYALVSAIVPPSGGEAATASADEPHPGDRPTAALTRVERGILGVVASIAIVPTVAWATMATVGLDVVVVLAVVAGITVVASGIAALRARRTNPAVTPGASRRPGRRRGSDRDPTRSNRIVANGITALAIVLAALLLVASASVALTGTGDDSPGTEFYVADAGAASGGDLRPADDGAVTLRIAQHGAEPERFTVVVVLERNDSSEATELDRATTSVAPDDTVEESVELSGADLAANDTVRFLLYRGEAPSSPDPGAAHRELRLSVVEGEE